MKDKLTSDEVFDILKGAMPIALAGYLMDAVHPLGREGLEMVQAVREAAAAEERIKVEAQAAEIEKLREALREVFEEWAGSEGFIPETAPEGYLLHLTKRMADIARAALGETK